MTKTHTVDDYKCYFCLKRKSKFLVFWMNIANNKYALLKWGSKLSYTWLVIDPKTILKGYSISVLTNK